MKTILVSLISDNLIPNFLLIKELEGKYDELLFISTDKMEKRNQRENLEKALELEKDSVPYIIVENDDYYTTKIQFRDLELLDEETEYVVNLTGGTKMMSLAVYEYFKASPQSVFCYVPIGKNVIRFTDNDNVVDLKYRVSLKEYFLLYGITFEAKERLAYPEEKTKQLFNNLKNNNFILGRIEKLRNAQFLPDAKDKVYYSGEWFEEYVYSRFKKEFSLEDKYIATGAKIYRPGIEVKGHNNEIDVMFVYENNLYVMECKVGMKGFVPKSIAQKAITSKSDRKGLKETAVNYLYKLAAISSDYGLYVNSYLCTLENFNDLETISDSSLKQMQTRVKILKIKAIFDCNVFATPGNLIKEPKVDFSGIRFFKKIEDEPKVERPLFSEILSMEPQNTEESMTLFSGVCNERYKVLLDGYEKDIPLVVRRKVFKDEIIGSRITVKAIQLNNKGEITQAEFVSVENEEVE